MTTITARRRCYLILLRLLTVSCYPNFSQSLVPPSSLPMFGSHRTTVTNRNDRTTLYYFDDVSRFSLYWSPEGQRRPRLPGELSWEEESELKKKFAQDKLDAMRRLLDKRSPPTTSNDDADDDSVASRTTRWARECGLVGERFTEEVFSHVDAVRVSETDNVPGALAELWDLVGGITTNASLATVDGTKKKAVTFLVLPRALESWRDAAKLVSAVEYCYASCGENPERQRFAVALFHPRYRNDAPEMFHPYRFSPWPTLGIWIDGDGGADNRIRNLLIQPRRGTTNEENSSPPPQISSTEVRAQRQILESIFHDAAAASSGRHENDDDVVGTAKEWIETTKARRTLRRLENDGGDDDVLSHLDTIARWVVSDADDAEGLYADVWNEVVSLVGSDATTKTRSALVVAPRYAPHSVRTFKRFAVTINAALKGLCGGKPFIELFHPEYAGTNESYDSFRRSPYPSLQIVYDEEGRA